MNYYSRWRDVTRLSDIKYLSAKFQDYTRIMNVYPRNNSGLNVSYCTSDIFLWPDALPQFKDMQFSLLWNEKWLKKDPLIAQWSIWSCAQMWSYFYGRVQKETDYAVIAARMENVTTGANWSRSDRLLSSWYIDQMVQAKPLDKNASDSDKLFILVTN